MIDNIIVGKPIVTLEEIGICKEDKTIYSNERYLPKLLLELGLVPSISWVRKNKPEYNIELSKLDLLEVRLGKKKKPIWIVVGD